MGEVWRGRHKGQDLPVAVKILTRRDTLDARYEIGFREEVRAAASLDHPNIVTVYDYGRTTLETEEFTNGRYANGSPYLVMELVDGFPLKQLCGRVAWNTLHRLLMALLDSLGHAHARGVIHRDLKPQNVMIAYDADRALEVKLTDFGLAHAMHHDAVNPFLDRMAGTPNYMAPEQVMVSWRDYGPWTDLYAVGCLAHALVDGKPPFAGRGARTILRAHLEDPPPIILGDVPDGFRLWVNRLLEKEPARRYACAADAAWALKRLNDEAPFTADDAAATRLDMAMVQSSGALDPSILVSEVRHTLSWAKDEWSRDESGSFLPGSEVPRVPQEWRNPIDLSWNPLVGAGLGLWGLRTLPLVGRDAERDRLWRMLTDVHADGRPRAAVLEGPSGFGKSRLARWVSERAAEFGVAAVIEATHSPLGGTHDGLSAAFARFHQCHGLGRTPTTVRLSKALRAMGETNEEVWHQLAEVLFTPQAGEDAPRISPRRRRSILMAHLQRLARRRPILLMVDDAHWGAEALDFVRSVLTRDDLHVMSVLTSDSGRVLAYFIAHAAGNKVHVSEVGVSSPQACPIALAACGQLAADANLGHIRFHMPPPHPFARHLLQYHSTHEMHIVRDQGGMMAFVDQAEALESLIPEWEDLLSHTDLRNEQIELTLVVDRVSYRVRTRSGAVDIARQSGANRLSITTADLMHLVTGYRHLDDILAKRRRILTAAARALLAILFPKRTPYVWGFDQF